MEKTNMEETNPKTEFDESVTNEDETKTPEKAESLLSSSVLLTPDASPVKAKESATESEPTSDNTNKVVTSGGDKSPVSDHTYATNESVLTKPDSDHSDMSSHCKHLQGSKEKPSETAAASPTTVPKKRKGRQGKAKNATPDKTSQPRPKSGRRKKTEPELRNHTITDYFPVRRSGRRTETSIKKDELQKLEEKILSRCEDGLKVVNLEEKGRGVVATKQFSKGEFVVEYAGELINLDEAKEKEQSYADNPKIGCYMYYFIHKNRRYCVDATAESGKLGRLINHSRRGNCQTRVVEVQKQPYLILVASREIQVGEELLYDYGDRSKSSIESHPWLML